MQTVQLIFSICYAVILLFTSLYFVVAVSGAAQIMGDLVTGRVAETRGQALNVPFDERDGAGKYHFITDVLRWRAQTNPENQLYSVIDAKVWSRRTECIITFLYFILLCTRVLINCY